MRIIIALLLALLGITTSCSSKEKTDNLQITEDGKVIIPVLTENDSIQIFDVKSSRNSIDFFNNLGQSYFIKVEDPVIEDGMVVNAIVYFNGIGFGATSHYDNDGAFSGVHLISTKNDDETYQIIKDAVMYFYGEKEDDEWHTCRWFTDSLQIDLRPLHTDECGTVMMWMF